ncbi:pilus assembly protein PilP [Alteromonas sp. ASW11-130]|uniref:pilus assembly protein PilP n=1 Tax=Alteromonas sp. ASW11-130 TaxID=3015775 RepID=UPI00224214E6|nr:pilus assembly protein PilP [Alteromonas sp. ASW11-130]MCW8090928.1 pilus assembly protein PilP [Alteromonas sp. ASW11-130]
MKYYTVLVLVSTFLLTACAPSLNDLTTFTAQVKANTQVNIEPYPEFTKPPSAQYTAQNMRSPFTRPKESSTPVAVAKQANCLQPDFSRKKARLEEYGLDALALSGSFTTQGTRWALFKSNDGSLHKAQIGSRIGLFYGKIKEINNKSVKIEQLLPDGAGCWQRKEVTLTMSSAAGENENV